VIKNLSLAKRKEGMSPEGFQEHWRVVHGALASKTPGLRRYIQSPVLLETYKNETQPEYDGIAELWWDSVEAFRQAQQTPQWQAAVADSPNFLGKGSVTILTEEVPIVDALPSAREREGMVKYISYFSRKEGMSVEDFQTYWRDKHPPLALANPGIRRYVQNHVLPDQYQSGAEPPYDGVTVIWLDDMDAYRAGLGRPRRPRSPDGPPPPEGAVVYFLKDARVGVILTREIIIVD
jgi:uncharacterized protein (TIGR02118 family)